MDRLRTSPTDRPTHDRQEAGTRASSARAFSGTADQAAGESGPGARVGQRSLASGRLRSVGLTRLTVVGAVLGMAAGAHVGLASDPASATETRPSHTAPLDPLEMVAPTRGRVLGAIVEKRLLSYPFEQVWPTAIRYLRVDRGYGIQDKDADAGYILFDFELAGGTQDAPRTGQGSLELIRSKDASGRPSVQLQVSTNAGPVHMAFTILDGLATKVRDERGQPAQPPRKPAPKPGKKPGAKPGKKPGKTGV